MPRTSSDTTSTSSTPFSPFSSTYSAASDNTTASEEEADLGAFTSIFRALSQLQTNRSSVDLHGSPSSTSHVLATHSQTSSPAPFSPLAHSRVAESNRHASPASWPLDEDDEDNDVVLTDELYSGETPSFSDVEDPSQSKGEAPTVWTHVPVTSYLSLSSPPSDPPPSFDADSIASEPTLGGLDAALLYIAKERTRLAGKLDAAPIITDTDSHAKSSAQDANNETEDLSEGETVVEPSDSDSSPPRFPTHSASRSPLANSRSRKLYKPPPSTRGGMRKLDTNHASNSQDTLTSQSSASRKATPPSFARRLSTAFPADASYLRTAITGQSNYASWSPTALEVNTRGGPLLHVFIDHSNILIGFLEWFKRCTPLSSQYDSPSSGSTKSKSNPRPVKKKARLSQTNLILLLERCRPCERRVLVASSPLYQNLNTIASIGYEVSVLQRVEIKESGSGVNAGAGGKKWSAEIVSSGAAGGGYSTSGPSRRWRTKGSNGKNKIGVGVIVHNGESNSTSESDSPKPLARQTQSGLTSPRSNSVFAIPAAPPTVFHPAHRKQKSSADGGENGPFLRPQQYQPPRQKRHREEAVDELLQLKFLQSLLDVPSPPPAGSTIVLATGDGASSQFNPDGFIGCVRRAVERGWKVELVGWEDTTSRAWTELRGLIGDAEAGPGLTIIGLERWGLDLAETD